MWGCLHTHDSQYSQSYGKTLPNHSVHAWIHPKSANEASVSCKEVLYRNTFPKEALISECALCLFTSPDKIKVHSESFFPLTNTASFHLSEGASGHWITKSCRPVAWPAEQQQKRQQRFPSLDDFLSSTEAAATHQWQDPGYSPGTNIYPGKKKKKWGERGCRRYREVPVSQSVRHLLPVSNRSLVIIKKGRPNNRPKQRQKLYSRFLQETGQSFRNQSKAGP